MFLPLRVQLTCTFFAKTVCNELTTKQQYNFIINLNINQNVFVMQKHLQKLLLIVAMMVVPWVTQAQSAPLSEYTVTTDVTTFNSIASTGTALSFSTQDDGYATTTLPFAFPYGTTVYNAGTSIVCSANGFIQLGASSPSSGTSATYSSSSYCYINAILQQDGHMGRNTGAGAYTRYDATAGTFTIEYHLLGAYLSPYGAYSYQVVLHTNGTIEIIYDSVNHQERRTVRKEFLDSHYIIDRFCIRVILGSN